MGRVARVVRVLSASACVALAATPGRAAVPAGFTDSLFVSVPAPTDVAFTPEGRVLVTSQSGTLRVFDPGGALVGSQSLPASQLCSNSERGLLGVAVDPAYASNRHVYLFYTRQKPGGGCSTVSGTPITSLTPVNRVSRFLLPTSGVLDLSNNSFDWAGRSASDRGMRVRSTMRADPE